MRPPSHSPQVGWGSFFGRSHPALQLRLRFPNRGVITRDWNCWGEAIRSFAVSTGKLADITPARTTLQLRGAAGLKTMAAVVGAMGGSASQRQSGHDNPATSPGNASGGIRTPGGDRRHPPAGAGHPGDSPVLAPMARAPAPASSTWPSAGAPDSFLAPNDLGFCRAHHDGRWLHRDGGGLLLRPAQLNWPFPSGSGWRARPAARFRPPRGGAAPFRQCGTASCATRSRLMYSDRRVRPGEAMRAAVRKVYLATGPVPRLRPGSKPTTAATWWIGPPAMAWGWNPAGAGGARLARLTFGRWADWMGSRCWPLAGLARRYAAGDAQAHRGPERPFSARCFRWLAPGAGAEPLLQPLPPRPGPCRPKPWSCTGRRPTAALALIPNQGTAQALVERAVSDG